MPLAVNGGFDGNRSRSQKGEVASAERVAVDIGEVLVAVLVVERYPWAGRESRDQVGTVSGGDTVLGSFTAHDGRKANIGNLSEPGPQLHELTRCCAIFLIRIDEKVGCAVVVSMLFRDFHRGAVHEGDEAMSLETRPIVWLKNSACSTASPYDACRFVVPTFADFPAGCVDGFVGPIHGRRNEDVVILEEAQSARVRVQVGWTRGRRKRDSYHSQLATAKVRDQYLGGRLGKRLNEAAVRVSQLRLKAGVFDCCPIRHIAFVRNGRSIASVAIPAFGEGVIGQISTIDGRWSLEGSRGNDMARRRVRSTTDTGHIPVLSGFLDEVDLKTRIVLAIPRHRRELLDHLSHRQHLARLVFLCNITVDVLPRHDQARLVHEIDGHVQIRKILLDLLYHVDPVVHPLDGALGVLYGSVPDADFDGQFLGGVADLLGG